VYDKNPKDHPDAVFIDEVRDIDRVEQDIQIGDSNAFGTGGIATKLSAARIVNQVGIPMAILNGQKRDVLLNALAGEEKATVFIPE
jgi:glutamate 5-kinase